MNPRRSVIAFVITRLDVGGAQQTVLELCRGLDSKRFRPVVVTGPDAGSGGTLVPEVLATGAEVKVLPELVSPVRPVADARAVAALRRLFRREPPALVHTHSSKAGVVGRAAARPMGVPVVHTVHGWSFHDRMPPPARWTYQVIERALARRTDALVVVADADRRTGLALGVGRPDQYVCIRSGVDLRVAAPGDRERARAALGLNGNRPVVGFVGRLAPQKDPHTLLRAFLRVHTDLPDAVLVMVGEGPMRHGLEQAARATGLAASVRFAGSRRDVPELLPAFDVLALPSRWEGMPRVLVEAAAAGVPVVATPVGGVTDFVEDGATGLLVPPGDPAALAGALGRLLGDEPLRAGLRARARARAAAFSADEMVRVTERLYEQLLSGPGPARSDAVPGAEADAVRVAG